MTLKTKSLKSRGDDLSLPQNQVKLLSKVNGEGYEAPLFVDKLREIDLFPLRPTDLEILQINVGYMCNLTCDHCHVDAGPDRKEIMTRDTMELCLRAIDLSNVHTVDLTGGAPEMNPDFEWFVEELTKRNVTTIVRSNLTILVSNKKYKKYPEFFKKHKVVVIASLPCYTKENVDKQRGDGVFDESIEALKALNAIGYGIEGSGLELDLVFNPGGASLPPPQEKLQEDYKRELLEYFGIEFNKLFTITNLPISRFLEFLLAAGRYEEYMNNLANAFNPSAAMGVMCRNTLSVSWDGDLFDCDFNQMLDLKVTNGAPRHIKDFNLELLSGRNIVLNQHCYGCTAGAGSSCQGSLT
jgi:radical SAM/Cys-rich protein